MLNMLFVNYNCGLKKLIASNQKTNLLRNGTNIASHQRFPLFVLVGVLQTQNKCFLSPKGI